MNVSIALCYCSVVEYICLCFTYTCSASRIFSIHPKDSLATVVTGMGLKAPLGKLVLIRLVGQDLSTSDNVFFTTNETDCPSTFYAAMYRLLDVTPDNTSAIIKVQFEPLEYGQDYWYICLMFTPASIRGSTRFTQHQGNKEWLRIHVFSVTNVEPLIPLWLRICVCIVLLIFSGLFSGLNLGLMSLDPTELKIIEKAGSPQEKQYAKRIAPLRKRGNLLLCSILLGNVLVNTTFTILFEEMTNNVVAVICSTAAIVVVGEIVPQAVCSRHGLAVGAKTYWITVLFVIITFPAAFPISLVLDLFLGQEMGQAFNKEKLQELIRVTADRRIIHDNEANIISGALQLTTKRVEDVMTRIEDVYMLEINTVLDFETITEIMHQGYTRIPVYDGEKTNIINLLNTKELALIDPDDKTLVSTVCRFYDHRPLFVDHDVKLDAMLQAFLQALEMIKYETIKFSFQFSIANCPYQIFKRSYKQYTYAFYHCRHFFTCPLSLTKIGYKLLLPYSYNMKNNSPNENLEPAQLHSLTVMNDSENCGLEML
ncbi:unnamed protein product [Candidula unifasciata]|uniref:CNNM transmembrane domain-containing protein n=1 Tax=Candidula unifasciata TaxID=100452 RepID=A0A8S3ZF17_9EUPU|nr:unnamed protein product [Candidula unifasciata]